MTCKKYFRSNNTNNMAIKYKANCGITLGNNSF